MIVASGIDCSQDSWTLDRQVQNLLWQNPTLRSVCVEMDGDSVILSGKVRSFYQKQLCISGAQRVAGVYHFVDRIDVR